MLVRCCVRGAVWWLPARDGAADSLQTEHLPSPWHIERSAFRALSTSRTDWGSGRRQAALRSAVTEAMLCRGRERFVVRRAEVYRTVDRHGELLLEYVRPEQRGEGAGLCEVEVEARIRIRVRLGCA